MYYNSSFEQSGILCEASTNAMSSNQINVLMIRKSQAFTNLRQPVIRFGYTVNITLSNGIDAAQIRVPSNSSLNNTLATNCMKTMVITGNNVQVLTMDLAFYVDICGPNVPISSLDAIGRALQNAWFSARPGNLFLKIIFFS